DPECPAIAAADALSGSLEGGAVGDLGLGDEDDSVARARENDRVLRLAERRSFYEDEGRIAALCVEPIAEKASRTVPSGVDFDAIGGFVTRPRGRGAPQGAAHPP